MMKKVFMIVLGLLTIMSASLSAKAQEVTFLLRPGWNWIGYPYPESASIEIAFGDFEPVSGDIIESEFGYSEYYEGYGWFGGIHNLEPGKGYNYYSNRTLPVTIVFGTPSSQSQVTVTTSEPLMITAISAMGGGEVTSNDGTYILVKGLCWATHENPTTNDDFYEEAESGVGTFSISMTGLNISTTYYVRAYAVTPNGTVYGDQKAFTTRDGIPIVTTDTVTSITGVTASCGGTVTDNGGLTVTARGVCWSTSHNPTVSDSHTTNGSGLGNFTSNITGLSISTTYYVRAYASTSQGTAYGEEVDFITRDGIPTVTTAEVSNIGVFGATCGGNVTNDGGLAVTRGVCWSTAPNPTVIDSHISDGFGLGSYSCYIGGLNYSTTYYIRAYASTNHATIYGEEVSFTTLDAPVGAIDGLFSVSTSQKVFFSQGNLQYQASTNTWRLAEHQWDYVGTQTIDYFGYAGGTVNGSDNDSISQTYSGWIDLFGWGTSGWDNGNTYYHPWDYHYVDSIVWEYFPNLYGPIGHNLTGAYADADWGIYNPIINGGNQPNQWRTLTKDEWVYVFNTRSTISGIRYAKAQVNNVNGVILLPDDWNTNVYTLNNTNTIDASYSSNVITVLTWDTLEQTGAVFLPAAGSRDANSVYFAGNHGEYWSSTRENDNIDHFAHNVNFSNSRIDPSELNWRSLGYSVRLVSLAQ